MRFYFINTRSKSLGFAILSGSPDIETFGIDYFNARIWGAPAVLLNFVLIGWFLGREKKALVLAISLVGNGSNVILDYLMINKLGWSSMGAGLATALSQYLALIIALIGVAISIDWKVLPVALKELFDWKALKIDCNSQRQHYGPLFGNDYCLFYLYQT